MPHTQRKKKPDRSKRKQILDEDGWTRVTSDPKPSSALLHSVRSVNDAHVEPHTHDLNLYDTLLGPQKAAEDMTLDKLVNHYKIIQSRWEKSESCRVLKDALKTRVLTKKIDNCICFGTGTPSGLKHGWIHRHDTALYQIAAFKTVVDVIEQVQGERLPAFAQEPNYNDFDEDLLKSLSITKVNHPTAFCLLVPDSFVYCPGAEQFVILRTLIFDPAIYLGSALELYRGGGEDLDAEKHRDMIREGRAGHWESSHVVDNYMKGKDMVRLPDLNVKDHPFHKVHLHWRPLASEEEESVKART